MIIGAGFAGITAARELSQAGYSTCILEAKDRIGGRAWSSEFADTGIELGGGYVYWTQPHIFAEITRYGLSLIERPYYASTNMMRKTRLLMDGKVRDGFSSEESQGIARAFADFVAPAKEVFPEPYSPFASDAASKYDYLSIADRIDELDLTALERTTLMRTASMQCNNMPSEGGYIEALRWYALANAHDETYAASVSRFTLAEGSGSLLSAMLEDSRADIRLSTHVHAVNAIEGGVRVETSSGTLSARKCIVATGVNVWKDIAFGAGLRKEKTSLSEEELSGKGAKIYVELKGRFEDSRWSATEGPILSVLPHVVSDERSVVVVFTNPGTPFAEVTHETIQAAMAAFDPDIDVLSFVYHDWVSDPHVRGTWGNFRPQQFSKYFAAAMESDGPVHFATSDIAQGWRGFFDGAIESGLRAARAVRQELRGGG